MSIAAISSSDIKKALSVLRYHHHRKVINDESYLDSSLESDTLEAISKLSDLHKRMTESNRSDFIGGEI
ncbi:hypothetical protein [Escherichia phage UPEC06]|nr:hypothetical protein [Escherichia phage UPEC06]